jgi:hypothetical protein
MEGQYCRVGSTTPITSGSHAGSRLESYYKAFISMASDTKYAGTQLGEFFEQKALKIKKTLDNLVN